MTEREQQQYDLEGMQYAEREYGSEPMLPAQIAEQYSAIQRRPVGDSTPVVIQKRESQLPGFVVKGVVGLALVAIIGKSIVVTILATFAWMEAHILASAAIAGGFAFVVYLASGWGEAVGSCGNKKTSKSGGDNYYQYNYYYNNNGPNGLK